jgi:hypothetical protein
MLPVCEPLEKLTVRPAETLSLGDLHAKPLPETQE